MYSPEEYMYSPEEYMYSPEVLYWRAVNELAVWRGAVR